MAISTAVKTTGGKRLSRILREAGRGGVRNVKVGFFSTAKYQDGTPVAAVAARNEFGTKNIPERPFFRQALAKMKNGGAANVVKAGIDPRKMVVNKTLASRVGEYAQGQVRKLIVELKRPRNRPSTLRAKFPKTNPLIDTGKMRLSVTWKVDE